MPNRLIRENWLDSEPVSALSPEAERFLLRLTLCADDAGRFDGRPAILRSRLFPLRGDIGEGQVGAWLEECVRAGLVIPYAFEGRPLLQIADWQKTGPALTSRFPWRDGAHAIGYVQRDTRDGMKDYVASSLRQPLPNPSATHPATQSPPPEPPASLSEQPIPNPSASLTDGIAPVSYVDVDGDGCGDGDVGGGGDVSGRTPAPSSPSAPPSVSGKGTAEHPDPPGLPEVLDFARGGAGIDPEVAETWWHEVEGRGWRDGRGQPIDPRRWRNALTAYALKWRANERRTSGDRPPLPRLVENIQIKELT